MLNRNCSGYVERFDQHHDLTMQDHPTIDHAIQLYRGWCLRNASVVNAALRWNAGDFGANDLNEDDDIWLLVEGMRQLDDEVIWANS